MRVSWIGVLLFAVLAVSASPAAAGSSRPIVTVAREGGYCPAPGCPATKLLISDTTISGDGYVSRPLKPAERTALLRAVGKLDVGYLRAHPFKGMCPTAYDGQMSTYTFRGFVRAVPQCKYDVRRIEAVRLTERLIATLKPSAR